MPLQIKRFGWRKDGLDRRDNKFAMVPIALPARVDYRSADAPIYDQGQLGSCTSNMGCGLFDFERKRQGLPAIDLSRLALYYWTRLLEGTPLEDAGASIRDTFKVMASVGIAPETDWPYDDIKFAQAPPAIAVTDALANTVLAYQSLNNANLPMLKNALANGFTFGFGFNVYDSFMNIGSSGLMPVPTASENLQGGHAVRTVGYDDNIRCPNSAKPGAFIVANSWGTGFGDRGYIYMPYEFMVDPTMVADAWALRLVAPKK